MKYVFFGSGSFGAEVLKQLNPLPKLVITQPDRLGGRGMTTLISTPVKSASQQLNLPTSHSLKVRNLLKFDLALVVDYGNKIPNDWLGLPKYGFYNIHPSLLAKYRGTSPIQTALLNNEKQTGVSIIQMDKEFDHGPILAQVKVKIDINDTTPLLSEKLARLGALEFNQLITNPTSSSAYLPGLRTTKQNHKQASFTKKLTKQDGCIPIEQLTSYLEPLFKKNNLLHLLPTRDSWQNQLSQLELHNKIRALQPWPGVWTKTKTKTIKIIKSEFKKTLSITALNINGKTYRV